MGTSNPQLTTLCAAIYSKSCSLAVGCILLLLGPSKAWTHTDTNFSSKILFSYHLPGKASTDYSRSAWNQLLKNGHTHKPAGYLLNDVCFCDSTPNKQFTEGRFHFGLYFEGVESIMAGKAQRRGHEVAGACTQETEGDKCWHSACFLPFLFCFVLYLVLDSSL